MQVGYAGDVELRSLRLVLLGRFRGKDSLDSELLGHGLATIGDRGPNSDPQSTHTKVIIAIRQHDAVYNTRGGPAPLTGIRRVKQHKINNLIET